ncbi:MAG: alkaline phosphatase D family protein [Flavobacteriales bacterium]|nr:alkaline phosphatase D family protein [Flavobacteriales bacterium]
MDFVRLVVNSGLVTADTASDFTVKVDAWGLLADAWYFYRFTADGTTSMVGKTRTMPSGPQDELKLAVTSCSNYNGGTYFHGYNEIALRTDIDAVLHLGDYFYEGGGGVSGTGVVIVPPHETVSLQDYRQRFASYRLDSNLRKLHAMLPWYVVYDDHETANNSWFGGAEGHDPSTDGEWFERKAAALQAYFEWQPIRNNPTPGDYHIYRKFPLGDLAELIMLDTRLEGRSEQIALGEQGYDDTTRTILGATQMQWLKDGLSQSDGQWKIIGQQVIFAPIELPEIPLLFPGGPANMDQWDGYRPDRNKVIDHVMDGGIEDVVFLTGDVHTTWANDVPILNGGYDPETGAGSAFVEFVVPGITSGGLDLPVPSVIVSTFNPHVKYLEVSLRGYGVLTVTPEKADMQWFHISGVDEPTYAPIDGEHWMVLDGERFLRVYGNVGIPSIGSSTNAGWITELYPNPSNGILNLELAYPQNKQLELTVLNLLGETVHAKVLSNHTSRTNIDLADQSAGTYILKLSDGNRTDTQLFVRN